MPSNALRRVPLSSPEEAIRAIEKDGGVILTEFTSLSEVEEVNSDMAPFMSAEVSS
jgi:DNA-directed RNA polymerase alpha subunit